MIYIMRAHMISNGRFDMKTRQAAMKMFNEKVSSVFNLTSATHDKGKYNNRSECLRVHVMQRFSLCSKVRMMTTAD